MSRELIWRKATVATIILLMLAGWAYLFRGMTPALWQTVFFPGTVLTLAILFTPATVRPAVRLLLTSIVLVLLYLTTHLEQGPFPRTEIIAVTALWAAGQIGLVIVSARVDAGKAGPLLRSLFEQGFFATYWNMRHGGFGAAIARKSSASRWAFAILLVSLLLWRSDALEPKENEYIYSVAIMKARPGTSNAIVVSLTTPDNNSRKYLHTALGLCRTLREAGAVVSCFPRRGSVDSLSGHLVDSIEAAGGMTFIQPLPAEFYRFLSMSYPFVRYQAVDISWKYGKPILHPGLVAAARFLKAPLKVPPQLLQDPHAAIRISLSRNGSYTLEMPHARNTSVRIGDRSVPIWSDGSSAVLSRVVMAGPGWNPSIFRADLEITDWDSAMTYFDYASGSWTRSLPDSVWKQVAGKMVFVQWINKGEDVRRDDATGPATIADMVVRGFTIDRAGAWHVAVSCLVLLVGVILFSRTRTGILVAAMMGLGIVLVFLDGWIFWEYLVVSNLIYPAFCAGMAAVILPLVRLSRE